MSDDAAHDGHAADPEVLERLRHDLRSPLAVIVGFADVIANRATLSDEERRDYAARITEAAGDIRGLLDDALG